MNVLNLYPFVRMIKYLLVEQDDQIIVIADYNCAYHTDLVKKYASSFSRILGGGQISFDLERKLLIFWGTSDSLDKEANHKLAITKCSEDLRNHLKDVFSKIDSELPAWKGRLDYKEFKFVDEEAANLL